MNNRLILPPFIPLPNNFIFKFIRLCFIRYNFKIIEYFLFRWSIIDYKFKVKFSLEYALKPIGDTYTSLKVEKFDNKWCITNIKEYNY